MSPTPRALELHEEVQDLVRRAQAVLSPTAGLDLTGLQRCFVVHGNEDLLTLAAPGLVTRVAAGAPGVTLRLLVEETGDGDELTRGRADVEVGGALPASAQGAAAIRSVVVGHDQLVLAVGTGHPLAQAGAVTVQALAGAHHVAVSRRGRLHGPLDAQLASAGFARHVAASVPSTAVALEVVRAGVAVAVVPRRLVGPHSGVVLHELPLAAAALPVVMRWHRRHHSDPAHTWLREQVVSALTEALQA